jgi:hypothetical protein
MHMRLFPLLLLATAVGTLPACRRSQDAGKDPYAAIAATAIPAIEKAMGLPFKTPPKLERRSKEQVRAFVLGEIQNERVQASLRGSERAYKLLGMIPDTMQLQSFLVNLLTEQIVGFYDPKTKVLYVVDGSPKDVAQVTVTHELVHALQDQYVSLDSVQNDTSNNDRRVAAQTVFEGQAVYIQLQAMLGNNVNALNMPGGWDRVRQSIRDNQASMPIFSAAPVVIQETLIFPYLSGAEFIKNYAEREHGVPFNNMPVSTEQIMHQNAFFGRRDEPTSLAFSATPQGIAREYEDNLGEFETRLFLYQHLNNQDEAIRGASGWDGDRYLVFKTAAGDGIAWATVWDTREDAADFYMLATRVVEARKNSGHGATRTMTVTTGDVAGRPVVLLTDVPVGTPASAVTLKAVEIKRP